MKLRHLSFLLLCIISCQKKEISAPELSKDSENQEQLVELVVKFNSQTHELIKDQFDNGILITKSMGLNDFIDNYAVKSVSRVFIGSEEFAERHRREGLDRWYCITYDASKLPATKASGELGLIEGVEIAETLPQIKINDTNDTYFDRQWALYQSNGIDINVQKVWEHYTTGDKNVRVAVVDSGVDPNHEDLVVDLKRSKNFVSGTRITGCDHGTHVAGIIAAVRNNGKGISGIAGGDASKGIHPVTIMSCQTGDGNTLSNSASAIVWAADNGAVIAQNSWGYDYDYNNNGKYDGDELKDALNGKVSSADKAAIDYFIKYAGCDNDGNQLPDSPMKGGVVVFAAGNENLANGVPANYAPVIAVGSMDNSGHKSSFSNYGDWVDICAPGSSIFSTVPGSYATLSGTSMACPQVSGVAALVLSYRGGDGFTNEMLKDCLLKGAAEGKIVARQIGPMLDAMGAMTYGLVGKPDAAAMGDITVNSNSAKISTSVVGDGTNTAMPAYAIKAYISQSRSDLENINLQKPVNTVKTFTTVTLDKTIGEEVVIDVADLEFNMKYHCLLVAMNYGGVYGNPTSISVFSTDQNNAPIIEPSEDISNLIIKATATKIIKFNIYDKDGHSFTSSYISGSEADTFNKNPNNDYWELKIDATKAQPGKYTAQIYAIDKYNLETKLDIPYTILDNQAPKAAEKIHNVLIYEKDSSVELGITNCFVDEDNDPLEYSVENNNPGVAHIIVTDGVMHITPIKAGTCSVEVKASDPKGLFASQIVTVIVRKKGETLSVHPVQVIDYLNIETGAEKAKSHLSIVSLSGAVIVDQDIEASAFEPAKIDMRNVAPGQYIVNVDQNNKTIVKL